jgi:hypothetical protein
MMRYLAGTDVGAFPKDRLLTNRGHSEIECYGIQPCVDRLSLPRESKRTQIITAKTRANRLCCLVNDDTSVYQPARLPTQASKSSRKFNTLRSVFFCPSNHLAIRHGFPADIDSLGQLRKEAALHRLR